MIVCAIRVADGEARIELVESGTSYNAVKVTNTATVDALVKIWIAGIKLLEYTIPAGTDYTRSVTARSLSSYLTMNVTSQFYATAKVT